MVKIILELEEICVQRKVEGMVIIRNGFAIKGWKKGSENCVYNKHDPTHMSSV